MDTERNGTKPLSPQEGKSGGKLWKAVRCAAFLCLLAFLLIHIGYVLRQIPWRYSKNTFPAFYAEEKNSLDVVTLGSSGCYQFFDTPYLYEKFGLTSFNLSVPIQPALSTPFLMDEIETRQSPQLYVVEARCYIRKPGKKPNRSLYLLTDSMNFGLNKLKMIVHAYDSIAEEVRAFIDLWKYHSYWTEYTSEVLEYWNNTKKSVLKTWRNRPKVRPQNAPKQDEGLTPLPLDEKNEAELRFLLEECRKKGRQVLFVATPFIYKESFTRRKLSLKEIVESYGYPFLDLTDGESYGLDYSTDFWDHRHVNYHGAEKVTNVLGEYIEKEYNIHAQHTDTVTADWENCVQINQEKVRIIEEGNAGSEDEEDEEDTSDLIED